jgi:hypothetical protein
MMSVGVGVIAHGVWDVPSDGDQHLTEHLPTFQPLVLGQAVPQIRWTAGR